MDAPSSSPKVVIRALAKPKTPNQKRNELARLKHAVNTMSLVVLNEKFQRGDSEKKRQRNDWFALNVATWLIA